MVTATKAMAHNRKTTSQIVGAIVRRPNALRLLAGAFCSALITLPAGAEPWRVVPQISLSETYTDNAQLAPSASAKDSLVSNITAAIRIERQGPRSSVSINYSQQQLFYSDFPRLNNRQNALTSSLTTQIVDNWFFLDARANISQENQSAFGSAISANAAANNQDRTETRTYQLSPNIRGSFTDRAVYQLRLNETQSESDRGALSNAVSQSFPTTRSTEWIGRIRNASLAAPMGWALDLNSLAVRSSVIGNKLDARLSASVIYGFNSQLHVSLIGGAERSDFASVDRKTNTTYGAAVEYTPNPRTQVLAGSESRFFGHSHNFIFAHRTPVTAWRLASAREIATLPNELATRNGGVLASLLSDLVAASIPNPVARAEAVRNRFESVGGAPNPITTGNFLTQRPYVTKNTEASVALLGLRNTITATVSQSDRRSFGNLPAEAATPNTFTNDDNVRRKRASLSWAYRLTSTTVMTLQASRTRTDSLLAPLLHAAPFILIPRSDQQMHSLFITKTLGQHTSASLGVRHVKFESTAFTSYGENALVGTFIVRF